MALNMTNDTFTTVVLDVRPMLRGSEKAVVERMLGRQTGVESVMADSVAQTATVSDSDPHRATEAAPAAAGGQAAAAQPGATR
jgi:hypothetical protein